MTIEDNIARLREALAAGPTPGPWRVKPADAWTSASGAFCQWGKFLISAGAEDFEDGAYYRIGEVSNVNNSPANQANAALIAAADPATIAALLAAWDEREAMRKDAERYRRWREGFTSTEIDPLLDALQRHAWTPDEVDSFIDAALQEHQA